MTTAPEVLRADPSVERTRSNQRAWGWYDWANSAYVTTTATVLISPYLTALAEQDVCPGLTPEQACDVPLKVLGVDIAVGSVAPYTITLATIVSALVLVFVGAIADRMPRPTLLLGGLAWTGALAASLMFFLQGDSWELGVLLLVIANLCLGASLVVYDALLNRIAHPDERDRVSSRGWALGYLGGGLLLVANLAVLTLYEKIGLSYGMAIRLSLLSAGLWWGLFTLVPVLGLRRLRGTTATPVERRAGVVGGSIAQLRSTLSQLRNYPQTLMFLLAYLFFNDGMQTVISSASLYGTEALGFATSQMMITILVVQFVAFGGALLFGVIAGRVGAKKTVLGGIVTWTLVVTFAYFVPAGAFTVWIVCAVFIGLVMGGTQALARSLYSHLVPLGKESEFFSFYQAMERGTSWFGTLAFGLVFQLTGSYRPAILVTILFFVVGGMILTRVRVREGIEAAGNEQPALV